MFRNKANETVVEVRHPKSGARIGYVHLVFTTADHCFYEVCDADGNKAHVNDDTSGLTWPSMKYPAIGGGHAYLQSDGQWVDYRTLHPNARYDEWSEITLSKKNPAGGWWPYGNDKITKLQDKAIKAAIYVAIEHATAHNSALTAAGERENAERALYTAQIELEKAIKAKNTAEQAIANAEQIIAGSKAKLGGVRA